MGIRELNGRLAAECMEGLWEMQRKIREASPPTLEPYHWPWALVDTYLEEAEDTISFEDHPHGARRVLHFVNPGLQSAPGPNSIARTLAVGIQLVREDEIASAHRHSGNAFRFVIEGQDEAYTVVEGEPFPMETGDLVLTPPMTWHDHVNESSDPVIWLDGLDAPFVAGFGGALRDDHQEERQDRDKPLNYTRTKYGMLRPTADEQDHAVLPYRYPWEEAREALSLLYERDENFSPHDGYVLEYCNPVTGEPPTQPSLSLRLQRLPEGEPMAANSHTSTEIYHVVSGSGRTVIGDEMFEWGERDTFVVPPQRWHGHEATDEETILFVTSDRPIFEYLNIHVEEVRPSLPDDGED